MGWNTLGVSDTHVFENLVEGLEIVARVVARYSIFEEIYLTAASKAQQHLTEQLVELYAAILRYLCSAKKHYDRNTATRMIVTALRPPELDDAILHITKEEESVRRQADLVDAENTYNTVEASVSGILELKSKLHSLEAPFIRTVAQLSDIQDHMDSSGKWLLEDSKYTNWKSTSNSQILWLHGNAQSLFNSSQRSILKPTLDMYTHKQLKAEEDGLEPSGLSISECVELILKITATTSVTLVIDALDECCSRTRHELFSVLKRIVAESHNVAKILVSSRQDSDIDAHFDCQEQIRVTEDQTHGDLNRFIEAQVTAAVQGRRILPGQEISPALHKSIVEGLKSKAHGIRGASALYLAACWGVCDLVQLLIDQKVDVNIAGGRFGSALQVAAHNGHREVVRLLLRHGAEPRGSEYFPDPMSAAVAGGHGNMVRFPEHFEPEEHEDQLQAALYARKEKMVRELIDGQIDVEKQTGPFGNALQAAICGGKLDLVELIINSGADLNCRGRYGYPLRAAVIFEHEEIVHWLLENKQADANIADNDLGDCLQAAAFKGNTRLMGLLLDHGARVEPCRTELKQSLGGVYGIPLHAAAAAGSP
ncbi:unnamed protein product [Aureobasidium pullulans]|nr:unnamed protein product [Aureobasidium pullulans]